MDLLLELLTRTRHISVSYNVFTWDREIFPIPFVKSMEDIPMNDNDKVEKLVNLLGCSISEAMDVIKSDYRIDKGEKLFELTPEQKKAAKSATITTSGKNRKKTERIKKVDNDKLSLMNNIINSLNDYIQDIDIINPEREITFMYNDKKYKLVLSVPRK